jgi:hypothetical protein
MAERTVTTNLVGKDKSLSSTLDKASKSSSKFGAVLGKVGGVMKSGLAGGAAIAGVGIAAVGKFVFDGIKSAASYQKVLAKTAQVLKSTGNVAGTSVEGIKSMAAELESMSGVDEELIINSQNVLATFTNIRNVGKNKIFDMATKSALDMSVALGSDLQGASIQVGKALNDPIKGISALSKVGVTFTADQKKVIASLVKTGDTAGAQKVILAELNKEFGGQAAAAGKGFEGSMARAQDAVSDTGREIGIMLLPKLASAAEWLAKKIPVAVENFKAGWKGIGKGGDIAALARSLRGLSDQLSTIGKQAGDAKGNGFIKFAHATIRAFTTMSDGMQLFGANWQIIVGQVKSWNDTLAINWLKMINTIQRAGAKLPGPMGRHFKKMADTGSAEIRRLQGNLNKTNTEVAKARVRALEIRLRHLGQQKPTPKVKADIAQAQAQLRKIQARLNGVKGKTVSVRVNTTYAVYGNKGGHYEGGTFVKNAKGGPVYKGVPSIVGDGGREELFVPDQDGTILPKVPPASRPKAWGGMGGGGGGDTYNVYVSGVIAGSHDQLADTIVKAISRRPAGSARIPASAIGRRS